MNSWYLIVCLLLAQVLASSHYSGIDYKVVFGDDWGKAETLLDRNSKVFIELSKTYKVPYKEVAAIVFPELIRYSALKDKIEITLLKMLYVYKGVAYANFSVGIFQMKPSFAEMIWDNASGLEDKSVLCDSGVNIIQPDTLAWRKQIINDLENPVQQFRYLLAFYKICEQKFEWLPGADNTDRVRFLASAYNYGFNRSEELIKKMEKEKYFNTTTLKTGPFYSYADIAEYYFNTQN